MKGAGNGFGANPVNISGTRYFQHRQLFTSTGFYDDAYEVLLRVKLYAKQAAITFAWYTTNCKDSKPASRVNKGCRWENKGHGSFGASGACVCNGKVVGYSRNKCGK